MSQTIPATSASRDDRDVENRTIALKLIKSSNAAVTEFAKQMVTASLSAVGVILALAKFRGLAASGSAAARLGLAAACAGCLVAALLFAFAIRARRVAVSLDDYSEAPTHLLTVAMARQRVTNWGLGLLTAAIAVAIGVLLLS